MVTNHADKLSKSVEIFAWFAGWMMWLTGYEWALIASEKVAGI